MIKIETIDRGVVKVLCRRLDDLGKELGISLKIGNCSFDKSGKVADFQLKIAIIGKDGIIATVEASNPDEKFSMTRRLLRFYFP